MYANRGELRIAVESLGLSHLGPGRLNDYIDEAADELHKELLWAWRLASTSAQAPPVAVVALGNVEAVLDTQGNAPRLLEELDPARAKHSEFVASQSGQPQYWWRDFAAEGGNDIVQVWPVGGLISVQHFTDRIWKQGVHQAADDSDEPVCPTGLRDMIRALAGEKGLTDDGRADEAQSQRQSYERRLERETEHNDRTGVHEGLRSQVMIEEF